MLVRAWRRRNGTGNTCPAGPWLQAQLAAVAVLAVFTLFSFACGLAPNAITLVFVRIVQGVGAALLVPQVLTGIQLTFEGAALRWALGVYTGVRSKSIEVYCTPWSHVVAAVRRGVAEQVGGLLWKPPIDPSRAERGEGGGGPPEAA